MVGSMTFRHLRYVRRLCIRTAAIAAVATTLTIAANSVETPMVNLVTNALAAPQPQPTGGNVKFKVVPAAGPTTSPSNPGGKLPATGTGPVPEWLVAIGALLIIAGGTTMTAVRLRRAPRRDR